MDEEIELDGEDCPACGRPMLTRRCDVLGCDDGYIDMHEYDDPLLFDEGEEERCDECLGLGYVIWCRNCGHDHTRIRAREEN
jgi:hypothetical protein